MFSGSVRMQFDTSFTPPCAYEVCSACTQGTVRMIRAAQRWRAWLCASVSIYHAQPFLLFHWGLLARSLVTITPSNFRSAP